MFLNINFTKLGRTDMTGKKAPRTLDTFRDLKAVVQYRGKIERGAGPSAWTTMAAFDVESKAESYAKECSEGDRPWEYRWLPVRARSNCK